MMNSITDPATDGGTEHDRGRLARVVRGLGRDYAYVLPGFFLSLLAFVVLVPLFSLSLGTLVIWAGALLMPLTLIVAGAFAQLSRVRLLRWGGSLDPAVYRRHDHGWRGLIRLMSDPRRWLDLLFETLVAFPLRTFTFTVAVSWTATALGGVTFWLWGHYLPEDGDGSLAHLLMRAFHALGVLPELSAGYAFQSLVNLVAGLLVLAALPAVMRGLALLDASATAAALGGSGPGPASSRDASTRTPGPSDSPDALLPPRPAAPPSPAAPPGSAASSRPATSAGAAVQPGPADPQRPSARRHPAAAPSVTETSRASALTAEADEPEREDPGLGWSTEGWSWLLAGFAAIVMLTVAWPVLAVVYEVHAAIAMLLAVLHSAALVLAVRWPLVGTATGAAAAVGTLVATASVGGLPWPWPVPGMLVQLCIVLLVALRFRWTIALLAWVVPVGASLLPVLFLPAERFPGAMANLIVFAAIGAGLTLIGVLQRLWLLNRGELVSERRAGAEQLAKRRELEERNRIARELHDVVAHSMSVISVQASTAQYRLPDVDPRTAGEFDSIAGSARTALGEMRHLLSLLRGTEDTLLAPQPGLSDIAALVEATRRTGVPIDFTLTTAEHAVPESVPGATGVTAYRIVQEALSNALRHAPGAEVSVRVRIGVEAVEIAVANGPLADAGGALPVPGAGLGLAGIRERVEALGGSIEARPRAEGGFLVRARLLLG